MNRKILVIAFKFPPYSEVGALRWTKFSKYLAAAGYMIHVATVDWKNKSGQIWLKDVVSDNIIIHKLFSFYPHNLKYHKFKNNFMGNILNKIRNQIIKLLNLLYVPDEASYWGQSLLSYCGKLIKQHGIKTVVATGAPFMSNYWAVRLKENNAEIKVINDFRDEWYEPERFLFKYQKVKNEKIKQYVLNNSDAIVTVSQGLKKLFEIDISKKNKFEIIYNGVDYGIVKKIKIRKINRDFSFIYAGSLSNGRDAVLEKFLISVRNNYSEYKGIKVKLYSSNIEHIEKKYDDLIDKQILIINKPVSQEKLYEEIYKSFVALHFMPVTQSYIISVKLFEYGALKRPVLSFNKGFDTEKLINRHKLGYNVDYDDEKIINKTINKLYLLWKKNKNYSINPINLNEYSYEYLADKYKKIIEKYD